MLDFIQKHEYERKKLLATQGWCYFFPTSILPSFICHFLPFFLPSFPYTAPFFVPSSRPSFLHLFLPLYHSFLSSFPFTSPFIIPPLNPLYLSTRPSFHSILFPLSFHPFFLRFPSLFILSFLYPCLSFLSVLLFISQLITHCMLRICDLFAY